LDQRRIELGVGDDLVQLDQLSTAILVKLGENGVKTRDDLADLSGDELLELLEGESFSLDQANGIVMAARAHWFDDEEPPANIEVEEGDISEITN